MQPVILGMNAYNLLVTLGLAAGLTLLAYRSYRDRASPNTTALLAFAGLLGGAFGARLLHWIFMPGDYIPWYAAFLFLQGGFALNGGILCIVISVGVICRVQGLEYFAWIDRMTPSAPLAIIFFRLGCYCNGCCVGQPTELPCGVHLPPGSAASLRTAGASLHPAQLYAVVSVALILCILLLLERRHVAQGVVFGTYMLLYGVQRALIDLIRLEDPYNATSWVQPVNQSLSLVIALVGALVLVHIMRTQAHRRH